jgi:alkylhydroperoxidase family enzyme
VSRGATEDLVAKLADYEASDLPERTKAALRLADRLAGDHPAVDARLQAMLERHFTADELIDLGMTLTFASGWQRFIEAFGIVPDRWREGAPPPFRALLDAAPDPHPKETP